MLPFAVLAWETDLNLRGAIEQRYVTTFSSHQFLTGVVGSFGVTAKRPLATYQLSLSGAYFGAYQLESNASGSSSPQQVGGQLDGSATWQTSPRTELSLHTHGLIASELGPSQDDDRVHIDAFAGDRLQYAIAQDLGLGAGISPRVSLSVGAGYGQSGALAATGAEPAGIDTHSVRNSYSSRFAVTSVDQVSAELGLRYTRYENAIVDAALHRDPVDSYAGTALLTEAHEFSLNLRGSAGVGFTGAKWIRAGGAAGGSGLFPEGRVEMAYAGPSHETSWGYALSYSSIGSRIGDGQSHAAWLTTTSSPLRGRQLRDFAIRSGGRLSYGNTPLKEQGSSGAAHVWSAVASVDTACPLVPRLALTSGLAVELRHMAIESPLPEREVQSTSVRLTAVVGIGGVLWAHPSERSRAGE